MIPKYSRKHHKSKHQWLKGVCNNVATYKQIAPVNASRADSGSKIYSIISTESNREGFKSANAAFTTLKKLVKGKGGVRMCNYFSLSVTSKGLASRMGKGKGSFDYWSTPVQKGNVMYLLEGVPSLLASRAYKIASKKLSVKTRLIRN